MRAIRYSTPLSFFTRSYLTHHDLLDRSKRAGYPPQQGYCHGLSCYAAYTIITDQWPLFDKQLQKISTMSDPQHELEKDSIRFFDALAFGQEPENYTAFYNTTQKRNYTKQDPRTALYYFALQDKIKVSRSAYFSGIYSKEELSECFRLMQEANHAFPHHFSLILSSFGHSITAHIDPNLSQWHLININQLPKQVFDSNQHLAATVNEALSEKRDECVIHMHAFINDKNKNIAEKFWSSLKRNPEWKKLHHAKVKSTLFNNARENWLHMAASEGLKNEVRLLLKSKADVNQLSGNTTALQLACKNGHFLIAKLLLSNGAYPNLGTPTPLAHAINNGDFKIAELLLENGAKPDAGISALFATAEENDAAEFVNKTPLEIAIARDDIALVNLLLAHGADPNKGAPAPFFQVINNPEIASLLTAYGAKAGSQLFCKNTANTNSFFTAVKKEKGSERPTPIVKIKTY